MSQVNAEAAQNTSQAATEPNKQAGQEPAAVVVEPPKVDPSPAAAVTDPAPVKANEPPAAKEKVEPTFEIKNADGTVVEAAVVEKIVSFAKEQGLSPAQAQSLYNREVSSQQEQANQIKQTREGWIKAIESDSEIGGENAKQNLIEAQNQVKKWASPELIKIFDQSGIGDHPEIVRLFVRIGKASASDKFEKASPSVEVKHAKDVFYDKKPKGE